VAFACDFCEDSGGYPRCVELCPYEALEFSTLNQVGHESGKKAFMRIIAELE